MSVQDSEQDYDNQVENRSGEIADQTIEIAVNISFRRSQYGTISGVVIEFPDSLDADAVINILSRNGIAHSGGNGRKFSITGHPGCF